MVDINAGDLVRWKNPLYVLENGQPPKANSAWHYALVLFIKQQNFAVNPRGHMVDIELLLIGHGGTARFNLSLEFLRDLGEIQKQFEGEWVPVPQKD